MIEIINLNKKYEKTIALNNISLKIKKGDFFSLFGKNGAGKSTAIGILSSLIKKDSGTIIIDNYNLDTNMLEIKCLIGIVPQEYNFNQFETVLNIILNQAGYYGISRRYAYQISEKYLKLFNLWDKKHLISMHLSGGMKRCLMIIRALIHEPKILILDEPTAGVDIVLKRIIWNFLKDINKKGTTIILTTHYLEEIKHLCKNVAIINDGKILLQTTVELLLNKFEKKTYIVETKNTDKLDKLTNANLNIKYKDNNKREITFNKNLNLNYLFKILNEKNIIIKNITNQQENLENLFINLINN